jgi:hypothetical protein
MFVVKSCCRPLRNLPLFSLIVKSILKPQISTQFPPQDITITSRFHLPDTFLRESLNRSITIYATISLSQHNEAMLLDIRIHSLMARNQRP